MTHARCTALTAVTALLALCGCGSASDAVVGASGAGSTRDAEVSDVGFVRVVVEARDMVEVQHLVEARGVGEARDAGEASDASEASDSAVDPGLSEARCPPGMAYVAGGEFTMGDDADPSARPARRVRLSGYCIDRDEVTVARFRACPGDVCDAPAVGEGCNWGVDGRDAQPVNCVTWPAASAYCAWRGAALPTEAQWERAVRGDEGREFPWGAQGPEGRACWSGVGARSETCAVGAFPQGATVLGVNDMAGNVAEWTRDWFAPYPAGDAVDPIGPSSGARRVYRGGDFSDAHPDALRSTARGDAVEDASAGVGFRCARAACEGDACATACAEGEHLCQGYCAADDSVASCGDRCEPCEAPPHARAICVAGGCGYACDEGRADCDGDATNGCETASEIGDYDVCESRE